MFAKQIALALIVSCFAGCGGNYGSSTSQSQKTSVLSGSAGANYQSIGNTIFGSDGTTHQKIGNTVFSSDGTTHQRIGNSVFSSDGTVCQTIGSSTFCN